MKTLDKEKKIYLKPVVIDEINNTEKPPVKIDEVVFYVNRIFTVGEIIDTPLCEMSIAMHNFVARRLYFLKEENEKMEVYYGHASNGLGYFIADDEVAYSL